MKWQRARSEEQKEERISEIVTATARLYDTYTFDEITFARIAKEARFTRSNLYKYFKTKEEIFLGLLGQDIANWRRSLVEALRPGEVKSIGECAAIWARTLTEHERLLRLFSILFTSLEKNVSLESLVRFKSATRIELATMAQLLCTLFPTLTPEKAGRFLHVQGALAIGLYPATHLSDIQRQAMEQAGFEPIGMDFESTFREATEHLLRGLIG